MVHARLSYSHRACRYYFSALNPAAVVSSGDEITVETATHQAGDDYDKMVRGDPAMEVGTVCSRPSCCAHHLCALVLMHRPSWCQSLPK